MNNWHSYYKTSNDEIKLPTAYIVGNFPQSTNDIPSLLRHSDVVTLFHEMGHALHHLLSKVEEPFVSGIAGVAWDVVEFPSQFLEYFSYDKDVLKLFAKHYKTGEVLDDEAINRLIKARNFQSSMATVRQIEFALFDMLLHSEFSPDGDWRELAQRVRTEVAVIFPPAWHRFPTSFSHIFAGGYAAGYYSYKWAEVLSADAYAAFEEQGGLNRSVGLRLWQEVLAVGSSRPAMASFIAFRGREPSLEPLLRHNGMLTLETEAS
jgi:oligopeptidase A